MNVPLPWLESSVTKRFLFLGVAFEIHSDAPEVLEAFSSIYQRFEISDQLEPGRAPRTVFVVVNQAGCPPYIWSDGEVTQLGGGRAIPFSVYFFILNDLFADIRDYFMLHGGVLQHAGRAMVFTGPSSAGKTTLVMELVRRGYPFLSDELAPIHRETGIIEPFPRRVGIRNEENSFKEMVDIEELPGGRLGGACRPQWIFYLGPVPESEEAGPHRTVEVSFSETHAGLLEALGRMPQVMAVSERSDRFYPTLRLEILPVSFVEDLDRVCASQGVSILQYIQGRTEAPDYNATPQLFELKGIQGVMEVAKQVLNARPPSGLSHEFHGDQGAFLMAFATALSGCSIYRLTPGRLDQMIELIEREIQ